MIKILISPLIIAIINILFLKNTKQIINISLFLSSITWLISLFIWLNLDSSTWWFQYLDLDYQLGLDLLSTSFIVLTSFLIIVCILSLIKDPSMINLTNSSRIKEFLVLLFILEIALIFSFSSLNIIIFYVSFEATLIPMFLIVGIFGPRKEKTNASNYLFLYTLAGSLILIIGLISLVSWTGSSYYPLLQTIELDMNLQQWLFLSFTLGFAVKLPSFILHIWLPKAHVEAPLTGSVLLAGVLLKLGSYGLIRYCLVLFPLGMYFYSPIVLLLCILGIIYSSLSTIRQIDLKRIIAYSSIGHMAITTIGLFIFNTEGIEGAWYLMIAHGITSPGLFICVTLIYWRWKTRNLKYYRGLTQIIPLIIISFFIFTLANLGLPFTGNFIGEFLILLGAVKYNILLAGLATFTVIASAIYSLYFYIRLSYGPLKKELSQTVDLTKLEYGLLMPLVLSILFLGLYPELLLSQIRTNLDFLLPL